MLPDLAALRRRLQVSPIDDRTALTEAAVLYRSVARAVAGPTGTPGNRMPRHTTADLVELDALTSFDTATAAARFAGTLRHGTGVAPHVDSRVLGIRHRHEMHFVRVGETTRDPVMAALSGAWRNAQATISSTVRSGGATPPNATVLSSRRGMATAVAIWRALLLATTPVRNTAGLRLRIRDADLLALAVRSAHLLGVTTKARSVSGLGVLCIDEPMQVNRLLEVLVSRPAGMRRTVTPRQARRTAPASAPEQTRSAVRMLRRDAHAPATEPKRTGTLAVLPGRP
ncbi:MAG: hypothetical protein WCA46_00240, partial [Actinocatenispora sp.]